LKKSTLKDISKRTNLSVSAISKILSNAPDSFTSSAKKELVKKVAEELHYVPAFGSRLLNKRKTNTVGILMPMPAGVQGVHNWHFNEYIKTLIILCVYYLEQKEHSSYFSIFQSGTIDQAIDGLLYRGCESFIFLGKDTADDVSIIRKKMAEQNTTYIGFGTELDRNVYSDSASGIQEILKFFIAQKRKNFRLLLLKPSGALHKDRRHAGLASVFPEVPLPQLVKKYVHYFKSGFTSSYDEMSSIGYDAVRILFAKDPSVNAVMFFTDYYAFGGLKYFAEKQIIPGKDVLVAGFDNTFIASHGVTPFTSCAQDTEKIAYSLTEHLFAAKPCSVPVKPLVFIR